MTTLYLDLESYCEVPISNGTHAYAEQAEVMLIAYAMDSSPIVVVDLTDPARKNSSFGTLADIIELGDRVNNPNTRIVMHNGGNFDRTVLRHALGIDIPIERIHDTMVQALCHGLPGGLGPLCEIYRLPVDQAKDKEGRKYINMFCKPHPKDKIRRYTRETHPKEWQGFINYAKRDIESMRVLYQKLPRWNYPDNSGELSLWHLDQRINDRGFQVDTELAQAAIQAVAQEQTKLAVRAQGLTQNEVQSTTQRDVLLAHILKAYNITLPDMQMATLERRIADPELPDQLRELLAIRLQATTSSTAKYKALVNGVSKDGRLRGTLQFCGASRTGRWAGRTFQPQNLPRPQFSQKDIDYGISALKAGIADLTFENVMQCASSCIRGCIVAAPQRKLVVADLSNIEGRVAAWLSGEQWKLDAFRAYDRGEGDDLYKLAYARAFRVDPKTVTKDQRQIGKVMELMLQYQGGVGAFLTGAAEYGIDLDEMANTAWESIPRGIREEAKNWLESSYNKQGNYGLSEKTFIVCDSLKRMWRNAQPKIASVWDQINSSATLAIQVPQSETHAARCTFRRDGAWFRILLPSGRSLCYASPTVGEDGSIGYLGVNQYSRKWNNTHTYGGKLFENITQAVARDVMAFNMQRAENQGYEVVLTVHDELLTETPNSPEFTPEGLVAQMRCKPLWAEGLPLAAAGYESNRYKKE